MTEGVIMKQVKIAFDNMSDQDLILIERAIKTGEIYCPVKKMTKEEFAAMFGEDEK